MTKCNDCSADIFTIESNYGYEDGIDLCVTCYNTHVDNYDDESVSVVQKYETVEKQRKALMDKVHELEKKLKKMHEKYLDLRVQNTELKDKVRSMKHELR